MSARNGFGGAAVGARNGSAGEERRRVAVVGGGAAGAVAASHLLRAAGPDDRLEVELIDRTGRFGPGIAYGTADPLHLLNVPAVRMGAVAGNPEHFHEWLRDGGQAEPEEAFVTRGLYGDYLRDLLAQSERHSLGARLVQRQAEVVSIASRDALDRPGAAQGIARRDEDGPLQLSLADGGRIEADAVVLALGPLTGGDPVPIPEALKRSGAYVADPWAEGALDEARNDDSVLVIGTGLTMVDVALSLCTEGAGPSIRAVSRQGLVPRRHRRDLTHLQPFQLPLASGSLDLILAAVVKQICEVSQQGGDWRDVIDSMRPVTPAIWRSLPLAEKRHFLADLQRVWDVHRFRMAPTVADRLEALQAAGRVCFGAGAIRSIAPRASRVAVSLRRSGGQDFETIEVDRVINCSGAGCDLATQAPPLLRSLLDAGRARPDALGLGLDVEAGGSLLDARGEPSSRIFVVGSLRKGVEWEAIGITEIRDQSGAVAGQLAAPRLQEVAA